MKPSLSKTVKWGLSLLALTCIWAATSTRAALVPVTDNDPSPNVFDCSLAATPITVTIGTNTNVKAWYYKDTSAGAATPSTAGIPIPLIRVKAGDTITCRFVNNLPAGSMESFASIHWHGIELDNDSDGTAVTQDAVQPGQSYTYHFKTSRPGLFWFHSHIDPGSATFQGLLGVLLVQQTNEQNLITSGLIPDANSTIPLALGDIEFDPVTGKIGKFFPAKAKWLSINELAELCHEANTGDPNGDRNACSYAGKPGLIATVNGDAVNTNTGSLFPLYNVVPNKRIRLQLMNESISRDFHLTLKYPASAGAGADTNLYRIGGQGGVLNQARLEGGLWQGVGTNLNSGYGKGEIDIGSGDRADTMIYLTVSNLSNLTNGTIITLVGNPLGSGFNLSGPNLALDQGNTATNNIPTNYPVAYFRINGAPASDPPVADGTPVLPTPIESLKLLTTVPLTDPAPLGRVGTVNPVFTLTNETPVGFSNGNPSIDNIPAGVLDGNAGNGSFLFITNPPTTRYMHVGDVLELSVKNATPTVHPWHLHGFSMQPVRLVDNKTGDTNYVYGYNEFLDTINVYGGKTLVFRMRIDDRDKLCDESGAPLTGPTLMPCVNTSTNGGGAIGRWLYHCHIFLHAGLGMIGEFVVLDNTTPQQTNTLLLPDLTTNGVDVLATAGTGSQTVADNFQTTTNGPITGVSVWGSWSNDVVNPSASFELKFWTHVSTNYSLIARPGWQAWRELFPAGTYTATLVSITNVPEQFYDPSRSNLFHDTSIYRYDFTIPPYSAFYQYSSNIYWISITSYNTTNVTFFGWKSSATNSALNIPATWSQSLIGPHWTALRYPSSHPKAGQNMNMAFQLIIPVNPNGPQAQAPFVLLPPLVTVAAPNGKVTISWDGAGTLQYSDDVGGPWQDLDGITSPYEPPMDMPQRYYRIALP